MLEDVARARRPAALIEQLGLDQTAEHVAQPRLVEGGDRSQHLVGELAAQDGAQLRHLAQGRQSVEPRHQRFVQARGNADLGQRAGQRVTVSLGA
jgi:hypothetical protein